MSWQAYVDQQLIGTQNLDKAAIFSAQGDSIWATSPGFEVTPDEMKTIARIFSDHDKTHVWANGIHLEGTKYVAIKAESNYIAGKKGKEGIVVAKSAKALIVAHHPETVVSQAAVNTVVTLAKYLVEVGY